MAEYKKRILLCTSPLQVINAKSAMETIEEKGVLYKDYLVITHPILSIRSKELITKIGEQLNYKVILNFSEEFAIIFEHLRIKSIRFCIPFIDRRRIRNSNMVIKKLIRKIRSNLYSDNQCFDGIFCRKPGRIESFILQTILRKERLFCIEDGIGNYDNNNNWKNRYRAAQLQILDITSFLIKLAKGYKPKFIRHHLPIKYALIEQFSNLQYLDNIVTKHRFIKNIQKIKNTDSCYGLKSKVVIIGSLLGDMGKIKMSLIEEVEFYNNLILKIIKKHRVQNIEIWYKPHPRISRQAWDYKNTNLNCNIFGFSDNQLFELQMADQSFEAVYSVGSTSLLYAKVLFNINAYLIDMRGYNLHPTAFDMYYDVCTRYGVKVVSV